MPEGQPFRAGRTSQYRKSLIDNEIFEFIKSILTGIQERYYLHFCAVGSDKNHLHLLIEAPPRYSPSKIMQVCKSITAKEIFENFPRIKDFLWGGHFWSEGGHIDTVGDGYDVKAMEAYILKQGISKEQLTLFQFASP